MPKLQIKTYGDSVLRKKAKIIKSFDDKLGSTVDEMFDLMYKSNGVGLAAPQVGVSRRLIVLDTTEPGEKLALANPKIVWRNDEFSTMVEGCLSIPGIEGDVPRATKVKVKANDPRTGEDMTIEACDYLARVLQHEIDHLEGALFVDHLRESDRATLNRALEELAVA